MLFFVLQEDKSCLVMSCKVSKLCSARGHIMLFYVLAKGQIMLFRLYFVLQGHKNQILNKTLFVSH
jgi:hypothetical protein